MKGVWIKLLKPPTRSSIKSWAKITNENKICYMEPDAPSTILKEFNPSLPSIRPHQISKKMKTWDIETFI